MIFHPILISKTTYQSKLLGEEVYNFLCQTFEIPKEFDYDIIEITRDYIARPDLVSLTLYGTEMYADILCKLNGISNPFELNEGDKLLCPEADFMQSFMVSPIYDKFIEDSIDDNNNNKPAPKGVKEKRSANDAVIGDNRFYIDRNRRVVVY